MVAYAPSVGSSRDFDTEQRRTTQYHGAYGMPPPYASRSRNVSIIQQPPPPTVPGALEAERLDAANANPTQENWGLRENNRQKVAKAKVQAGNAHYNAWYERQQRQRLMTPMVPPSGDPAGASFPTAGAGGDGSWANNTAPSTAARPGVYAPPPPPQQQQQGPEFDDYTLRAWHQYNQQFPDEHRSLRDFATTFKPQADKIQQGLNAAYAAPPPAPSLDQARRDSAANVAGVKAAMDKFPANRPGGPSAPPPAMNAPPAPAAPAQGAPVPPPASAGPGAPPLSPTTGYSNSGLQGVGDGHLPGSNMIQGKALDEWGASIGVPRGRVVINGQDMGPRSDAEYEGLIRATLKNSPDYQKEKQTFDEQQTAAEQAKAAEAAKASQTAAAEAAMTPAERVAAIKGQTTEKVAAAKNDVALKGIDAKAYAGFGKNVTDVVRTGITAFTNFINTNTRANTSRENAKGHDETRVTIADKNNETKANIADQSNTTKQSALQLKDAYGRAKEKRLTEKDERLIQMDVAKRVDQHEKDLRKAGVADDKLPGLMLLYRNSLLATAGLHDWMVGPDGRPLNKPQQAATPAAPAPQANTPPASPASPQAPAPQAQSPAPALTPNADGTFSHPDHPGVKYRKVDGGYQKVS